ncbi:MAG: hypothetical protein WC186_06785 [Bacteroidales bacterium]
MKKILLPVLLLFAFTGLQAQKLTLSGYVKDMQGYYYFENPLVLPADGSFQQTTYNQIHNRLNLAFQPTNKLRFELGVRNRLIVGKLIHDIPGYADLFETDNGLADMSWNLVEKTNWFLNTSIDRFYADYTWKNLQLKVGRQRINWGINLVWNPNDLFNAFSYIDFDYEERPGSDAVLLTWYTSGSSGLDVAFKTDRYHNTTAAARYLFNFYDYDIQFIGGKNENDFVLGGGWSGNIGKVSFSGEGSFFTPLPGKEDLSSTSVSATISANYTFKNSLFVHSAFLFNSMGTTEREGGLSLINPNDNLSAKRLSIGKYEWFGQVSYPVNPILNVSLAGMLNPSDHSSYIGPMVTVSLLENLELMLTAQVLLGETGSEYGAFGNTYAGFGRLRWSF